MNSTKLASIGLAAALAAILPAVPAQAAGAARTFVSAAGSDSNNCTNVATPCRHLATAYAATAADGEIYVLDPANYGSLTITGPVSIEGHGWASIAPVSGSAAITITTPNQLFVSNTLISDNVGDGIQMSPTAGSASGVLNRVQLESNFNGLEVTNTLQIVNVTVANSVSANNVADGILASSQLGNAVSVTVRNSTVAGNGFDGLGAQNAGATIRATRSTITENNIAWAITSSGVVVSCADNNIDDNGSVNTEPPGPPFIQIAMPAEDFQQSRQCWHCCKCGTPAHIFPK